MTSDTSSSYVTAELAVTLAVVAAGIGYGYYSRTQQHQAEASFKGAEGQAKAGGGKKGKKNTKRKTTGGVGVSDDGAATPQVVPFPAVLSTGSSIPGGFDGASEDIELSDVAGSQSLSKSKKAGKKGKKAKQATPGAETPRPTAPHIPNSTSAPALQESDADGSTASAFAPLPTASQSQKKKKNKAKKAAEQQTGGHALEESTASITVDTDSSWTHVGTKKGGKVKGIAGTGSTSPEPTAASSTTPETTTGESSPVERREDASEGQTERRKTLAEKLLPKGRKTGVEDLLETPDYPTLSRVMRIAPPAGVKPVDGYSWGDYEDVSGDAENEKEGSEGEWGVVKSKKSNRPTTTTSTPSSSIIRPSTSSVPGAPQEKLSKTQKKNQKRKAEVKEAKALQDMEQEARKAEHKRQLERQRIIEQSQKSGKTGTKVGGGMKASVENGKLVWE